MTSFSKGFNKATIQHYIIPVCTKNSHTKNINKICPNGQSHNYDMDEQVFSCLLYNEHNIYMIQKTIIMYIK